MKTRLLLSSALVLSCGLASQLFAQATAVEAAASAVVSAATRSGAGAAQQDQLAQAGREAATKRQAAVQARANTHERPEDVVFQFVPPTSTRRPGHPTDPDLVLTESELATLNDIGGRLVDFVDSSYRIETNQTAHLDRLTKERSKETSTADDELGKKSAARELAASDLADAKKRKQDALAAKNEAQKAFDEAERQVKEMDARLERDYKEIGDKNDALERTEREIKDAIDADETAKGLADKAAAKAQDAADKLAAAKANKEKTAQDRETRKQAAKTAETEAAEAQSALGNARKARDEAVAAARKIRDEAVTAAETDRDKAIAAAEKARDEAVADARKARDEAVAADKDAADKAAGLAAEAARKSKERTRLEKAAAAARKAVGDTAAAAKAAGAKLDELRLKAGEKPGFWRRRAIRHAEADAARTTAAAKAASEAAPAAEAAAEAAKVASETAATKASEAAAKAKAASEAAAKAKETLANVSAEQKKAVRDVRAAEGAKAAAAIGQAKQTAKKAEETASETVKAAAATAQRTAKAAETAKAAAAEAVQAADKAAAALPVAEQAEKAAADAAADAKNAAEDTKKAIADKENLKDRIQQETDERNIANLMLEGEKKPLQLAVEDARDELDKKTAAFNEIDEIDIQEKQDLYDAACRDEAAARDAATHLSRSLDAAAGDAYYLAMKDEKALEKANQDLYDSFWNDYRAEARSKAGDIPVQAEEEALKSLEKARDNVVKADARLKAIVLAPAEAAVKAARAEVKNAESGAKAAESKVKDAEKTLAAANKDAEKAEDKVRSEKEAVEKAAKKAAEKAAKEAEKAVEKAVPEKAKADSGEPPASVAKAEKALFEAREAVEAAEKALAEARSAGEAAAKVLDGKRKALEAAEAELGKAVEKRDNATAELKSAKLELDNDEAAAEKAKKDVRDASGIVDGAVDILKKAFDEQVAATQLRKRNAANWIFMGENERLRQRAREVREAYRKARREYAAARKALHAERARFANGVIQWNTPAFANARADYRDKRVAFEKAEDDYNEYFSDSHTFQTADLSDEAADALYERESVLRALRGWRVKGDRRWLARTSVNGEPLLDTLADEMEWQAENVAGEAADNPDGVTLTDDQVAQCAAKAVEAVRRRAIYGGFYFAGAEADPSDKSIYVDKGRYGPLTVVFQDAEKQALETGRMFSDTNILAKLGSEAPLNAVREGEAFNFIEFRRRFTALNANPDIEKADVEFQLAPTQYDYGYDDEDPDMGTNRTTRAIKGVVKVQEKGFPAPVHGVIGIDNFNSMGGADKAVGEPETWMARVTLQTLDLWGLGHALTVSGNTSLDGSLYGGAASYYIPRSDDRTWFEGSWRRLGGWSWTLHGGWTEVNQDLSDLRGLTVLGTGYYTGLQATSRLFENEDQSVDFSLGATWRYVDSAVEIEGTRFDLGLGDGYTLIPLSAALMYSAKDIDIARGRNYATLELVYNAGGSDDRELKAFRPVITDANYFLARLQLARLQLLFEDSDTFLLPRMLFLRGDAQFASTEVIGAEQFGVGGHSSVRGYVEREFMGDHGASGTIEFRTPIGLGWIDRSGYSALSAADRLQFVYFLDLGWYSLDLGSEDDSEFLAGAGVGLRYNWKDLVLRFDWGIPIVRADNDENGNPEFETSSAGVGHISLQYQF